MTGEGNWTYLIGRQAPLLIDTGVGHRSHIEAIARAAPGGLGHVLVTHAHSDHISGAPAIHARWPSAVFSKHPWPGRDPQLPWHWLNDGAIVPSDEGELIVLHTPGHSPDHVTLWHAGSRTLFVGDMLVLGGTVVIPASHGGSLSRYLDSLDRMLALNPARALPAHGPVIEDPSALIHQYQAHRAQREEQVLAALGRGPTTVEAIASTIYQRLQEALMPMARESVLAHLQKLEGERQAIRDLDQWRMT